MEIVGRERELAAVAELLGGAEPGLRGVVLEGEPGIGKTTVWHAGVELASDPVLSCRPVEAETKLSYASLGDLLAPVTEALDGLAEPQRVALDVALLRRSAAGAKPDRRAVATGVYSLLRDAAPLVVAIDDVQWLDAASAAVLAFALRRLETCAVRVLLATRVGPDQLELVRTLGERVEHMRLEPLSLSAIHHVIKARIGRTFARPTLRRIVEASEGNPLFALELARALESELGPGEPLPVSGTLSGLMHERVRPVMSDALLAAASLSAPTTDVVDAGALEDAERAGVVEIVDGRIRFTHPLLASAVSSSASVEARRRVHRFLAAVVADSEEQARHLALSAEPPDDEVAAKLEAAAQHADRRAAPQVAAELAELACRFTDGDARPRRTLALAELLFRAGDTARARTLVEEVVVQEPEPHALELLARILYVSGTSAEAVARCEQALELAGDDLELQARIHATLSRVSWDDFERARRHTLAALELLEQLDDPDPLLLSHVLVAHITDIVFGGGQLPVAEIERALELEARAPSPDVADRASAALGAWLKHVGDFDGARRWLEATRRAAIEEGDDASLPYALSHLPQLELWLGNWDESAARAREHLQLADEMEQPGQRRQALFNLAQAHAHLGAIDDARETAEALLREGRDADEDWDVANALATLGLIELSVGDVEAANAALAENFALREGMQQGDISRAYIDYVEALVGCGDLDRAEAVASLVADRAEAGARETTLALAWRARALVAAARGDLDAAAAAVERALEQHALVTVPFDLARTLLVAGQVRRRRGERKRAKEAFGEAKATFERLGAPLWTERAEAELRRIPMRRSGSDELTPTEEQVAELAAAGHTNREMAQALFMSPKTVEANLTRIYRKLGIRSRAELGALMATRSKP